MEPEQEHTPTIASPRSPQEPDDLWDYGGGSREHEEVLGEEEGDDGQADTQAVEPDPDAPLDSDSQEEEARKKGKKRGVPNWAPAEAVACVWAQIARSDEQIQPLTELRKGAMKRRMSKAQELNGKGVGKTTCAAVGPQTRAQRSGLGRTVAQPLLV
eukprot:CAMPEP_0117657282 /NCGR_PEP_ID=MMETSP0804-20121206/5248_1 /TAXON_ID=1074897 /ORGANISM="Tetraselmis astigmatica, Strain CCMP880" /LENGTH=156 /DNA_ID=CAMNT_0005463727 /DNA_START=22 /DNA_END=493 /DNA_ORIENTATION=-